MSKKVGVLGPAGTYTEAAARELGYATEQLQHYLSVADEVDNVIAKEIDCAVVPFENSIEGSVGSTLDALLNSNVHVIREIVMPIHHSFAAQIGADIITVYSHWQAIAQCHKFLRELGKEVIAVSSTSQAARIASEDNRAAAITSLDAAQRYGLQILKEDIQDFKDNFTRFVVIARKGAKRQESQRYKTSVVLELAANRPGALYEALYEFAARQIDLTKIESRPTKRALGEYLFYIDIDGHAEDKHIKEALAQLRSQSQMLQVLGSYPSKKRFIH